MAERLTERFSNGQAAAAGCGNNCKYDYKYCDDNFAGDCPALTEIYEKLAHYEDLEEQGRLITLPCAVGDTVYGIVWENCHDGKCPWLDTTGKCTKGGISSEYCPQEVISWEFALEDLYNPRRFYLTREEAEAALKGAEHDTERND